MNNELLAVKRSLPRTVRYPVYAWLDECQRVVSPDLEFAIPEVRQLGIKLILAHQSFTQLKRPPDLDLTSLIFLPNTRLIFAEHGEDAELLSNEVASLRFDPMRIKDEIYSLQQLQTGHELVELSGSSTAHMDARKWEETYGQQWTRNRGSSRPEDSTVKTLSDAEARGDHRAHGRGSSTSTTHTENTHQQLIAKLDTIRQLCSRTYVSFDEQRQEWAKLIRSLRTGECLSKVWNDSHIHHVRVQETRPGILAFEPAVVQERLPQAWEAYERLLDWNFARDLFVSPAAIERETEDRLQRVLRPAITLSSNAAQSPTSEDFGA